jgi:ssDNA-binding Zn-finger/Zn-ribbon topoisomerase 1
MSNWYLKLCGKIASGIGLVDNYSDEHQKFLLSGFECPKCRQTLMKSYGVADVTCYDKNGKRVPVFLIRMRGRYFECPKCKYQWEFRKRQ